MAGLQPRLYQSLEFLAAALLFPLLCWYQWMEGGSRPGRWAGESCRGGVRLEQGSGNGLKPPKAALPHGTFRALQLEELASWVPAPCLAYGLSLIRRFRSVFPPLWSCLTPQARLQSLLQVGDSRPCLGAPLGGMAVSGRRNEGEPPRPRGTCWTWLSIPTGSWYRCAR